MPRNTTSPSNTSSSNWSLGQHDTECILIASLLNCHKPHLLNYAFSNLTPRHFSHENLQDIYAAAKAIYNQGDTLSSSSVASYLLKHSKNPAATLAISEKSIPVPSAIPNLTTKITTAYKRSQLTGQLKLALNKLADGHNPAEILDDLLTNSQEYTNDQKTADSEFAFVRYRDICRDLKPTEWLIENVLPSNSLACLFGAPGSYKSFLAVAWACSIATGTEWLGHQVKKKGPVFIIVGEGFSGYTKRFAAWSTFTGVCLDHAKIFISNMATQLTIDNTAAQIGIIIRKLTQEEGPPAMVVIDTLFRNFGPGDINTAKDMSHFVKNIDQYIGTDCTRLIVHHTGHSNRDRALGSIVLPAALEVEYCLKKHAKGSLVLTNKKMKDEEEWPQSMRLKALEIAIPSQSAEPMTSLILSTDDLPLDLKPEIKGKKMAKALKILEELHYSKQAISENKNDCNPKEPKVLTKTWREKCIKLEIYQRPAFYEAIKKLEERNYIKTDGTYVTLCNLS